MTKPKSKTVENSRNYTLKEAQTQPSGPINWCIRLLWFGKEEHKTSVEAIVLTRNDPRGIERPVACIYRHMCGLITMHTPPEAALTIDTVELHVLPIMRNFNANLKYCREQMERVKESLSEKHDIKQD